MREIVKFLFSSVTSWRDSYVRQLVLIPQFHVSYFPWRLTPSCFFVILYSGRGKDAGSFWVLTEALTHHCAENVDVSSSRGQGRAFCEGRWEFTGKSYFLVINVGLYQWIENRMNERWLTKPNLSTVYTLSLTSFSLTASFRAGRKVRE